MAKNLSIINEEVMQDKFVQMYMSGMRIVDIATELGVDRSTPYLWLKKDNIKQRIDKYKQEIETAGKNYIKSRYTQYLANIDALANQTDDKRTALTANQFMVDKMDGKAGQTISLETTIKEDKLSTEEIDRQLKELGVEDSTDDATIISE